MKNKGIVFSRSFLSVIILCEFDFLVCGTASNFIRYERELETYLKVEGARSSEGPGGLFSEVLAYVPIICSSLKASGYVLVLEKVPGVKLSTIWGTVSHEDVGNKLVRAVEVLRKVGCVHGDPNRDNILYDEHSSRLVLLDLESTYANDEGFDVEDGPELYYIMGQ